MSFKDGIPLLAPFDDEEEQSDDSFTVSTLPHRRKKVNKKHMVFCFVLLSALFLVVALVVGVTVPVVLVQQDHQGGGGNGGNGNSHIPSASTPSSVPSQNTPVLSTSVSTPNASVPTASSLVPSLSTSVSTPNGSVPTASSLVPSLSTSVSTPNASVPTASSLVPSLSTSVPASTSPHSVQPTPSASVSASQSAVVTPTPTPTPTPSPNFHQSKLDKRDYKFMTLQNRLRVLLISDPNSNISAASMDVAAGSFDDPDDLEGLAHFCEHMLFLGTAKFPDEAQYSKYLSQHGGYDNAFTSTQNTNFYFNVQADFLPTALDMFSQFFISPLFTNSSVGREVNAVNAEHEKNLLNDGWRLWEMLKNLSNPAHPFHKFSTGSLETLMKPGLLERLKEYYYSKYSANRMQLVIYGRDNLTMLTDWTLQFFQNISDRDINATLINTTSYPPPYNGRIVYYYPVADSNSLTILWQVPSQEKKYRNAISGFISRYLGQEDSGSVLHLLEEEGLVTSLSAGLEFDTETYTLLELQVELTEEGLRQVSRVVQAVHWYVGLLRQLNETEFMRRFEEYRAIEQIVFEYGEKQAPADYAQLLAGRMRVVDDPEDFLSSPQRFLPDHALFLSVLDCMYPQNATLFLSTQRLNIASLIANITGVSSQGQESLNQSSVDTPIPWPDSLDMYEAIYKIPYAVRNISEELAEFWSSSSEGFDSLALSPDNQFIVDNLEVLKKPDNASSNPQELRSDGGISLWWLLDTADFPEPRVNLRCDILSARAEPSPQWEALTQLFTATVKADLNTLLYGATEVGFTFDLSPLPRGISLSLSGLSDHNTVRKIITLVSRMLLSNKTGELFDASKQGAVDDLNNYNYTTLPYRYTPRYIQRILMDRPYWKNWQVLDNMLNLSLADVRSFASSQLLSNISLLCLAHGNVNRSNALSYINVLADQFKERLMEGGVVGEYQRMRVQLDSGRSYIATVPILNPEDQNSVVNILFQAGSGCVLTPDSAHAMCDNKSLVNSLHLSLLSQMIGSVCFNVLRTQQQLGYVVFCFSTFVDGSGSFQVLVQSQSHNASDVYGRIDTFLSDYYNTALNLSLLNSMWESQVSVLRSSLEQRDTTLGDRTDRLWGEVSTGRQQFTYNQQRVKVLDESGGDFSPESFRKFYNDHILSGETARRLLVVVSAEQGFATPANFTLLDYTHLNQTSTSFP